MPQIYNPTLAAESYWLASVAGDAPDHGGPFVGNPQTVCVRLAKQMPQPHAFAAHQILTCLERACDPAGLHEWTQGLAVQANGGVLVAAFAPTTDELPSRSFDRETPLPIQRAFLRHSGKTRTVPVKIGAHPDGLEASLATALRQLWTADETNAADLAALVERSIAAFPNADVHKAFAPHGLYVVLDRRPVQLLAPAYRSPAAANDPYAPGRAWVADAARAALERFIERGGDGWSTDSASGTVSHVARDPYGIDVLEVVINGQGRFFAWVRPGVPAITWIGS